MVERGKLIVYARGGNNRNEVGYFQPDLLSESLPCDNRADKRTLFTAVPVRGA